MSGKPTLTRATTILRPRTIASRSSTGMSSGGSWAKSPTCFAG